MVIAPPRSTFTTRVRAEDPSIYAGSEASGKTVWVYGVGIDEPLRMTRHRGARQETLFYLQNANGNVMALSNASGVVVERYRYPAFGREVVEDASGKHRKGSRFGNPYRFQGRWRDSAEGSPLYYFRFRMYEPGSGRFISRDPIVDTANMGNSYTLVGNRPIVLTDALGLEGPISTRANMSERNGPYVDAKNPLEIDLKADYLYSGDYHTLAIKAPNRLKLFYHNNLTRLAPMIKEAASSAKIPAWLLAGVVFGEMINMDSTFMGFSERSVENSWFGEYIYEKTDYYASVGLAQIKPLTAINRKLTKKSRLWGFLDDPELTIRKELMDDRTNLGASATFISQLAAEAIQAYKSGLGVAGRPSTQFGNFKWSLCDFDKIGQSALGGTGLQGQALVDAGRINLAGFFGAAHNDDRAVGLYEDGYGMNQRLFTVTAMNDLTRFGLLKTFGLDK